jgi:hypothetical protein
MNRDRRVTFVSWAAACLAALSLGCGAADEGFEVGEENLGEITDELCAGVTLTATSLAPMPSNTSIGLTAGGVACGAGETPEYRFSYKIDGGPTAYTEFRGWSTDPQATFDNTVLPSGKYTIAVDARNIGSKRARDSMKSVMLFSGNVCPTVTLATSPATPSLPGAQVLLTGSATCTEGAAQYRFAIRPPGATSYSELRGWGTHSMTWDTTGLAQGSYALQVFSRGNGNASTLEGMRSVSYMLADKCASVTASTVQPSPQPAGTPVTILGNATCTGGSTAELQYRYRLKGTSPWLMIEPWAPAAAAVWDTTALAPGLYQIYVEARAPGVNARQGSRSFYYTLQ